MRQRRWKNDEEKHSGKSILMTRRSCAGFPVGYGVNSAFSPFKQPIGERVQLSLFSLSQRGHSPNLEIGQMLCIRWYWSGSLILDGKMLHAKCCSEIRSKTNISARSEMLNMVGSPSETAPKLWEAGTGSSPPHLLCGRSFRCVKTKGCVAWYTTGHSISSKEEWSRLAAGASFARQRLHSEEKIFT